MTRVHVAIVIGSKSDAKWFKQERRGPDGKTEVFDVREILDLCGVSWELSAISTHRNPTALADYCNTLGALVVVAAASGSAGLPGAIAGLTEAEIPVIGVPLPRPEFPDADDALKSMLFMPPGTPVAVCGIGNWGMINAMVHACEIVAQSNPAVTEKLSAYRLQNNKKPEVAYERSAE